MGILLGVISGESHSGLTGRGKRLATICGRNPTMTIEDVKQAMTPGAIVSAVSGGGAVVAAIAVMILFMRRDEAYTATMREIATQFNVEVAASRKSREDNLHRLMDATASSRREDQDQLRGIISQQLAVTQEATAAARSLEAAVRAAELTAKELETVIRDRRPATKAP
jgi:hypothetical protein